MPHKVLTREQLEPLVAQGLSQQEMGNKLETVKRDVRYWLNKYAIKTVRSDRGQFTCACGERDPSKFWVGKPSVCRKCHSRKTIERYRKYKKQAVDYKGGCCQICSHSVLVALLFHHLDPAQKDLNWGVIRARRFERVKEELDKTILVCFNCHAEIHFGDEGCEVRRKFEVLVGKEVAELTYYYRDKNLKHALQRARRQTGV